MRILFTGARAPVTLELVRNFGANGWEVYVADSMKNGLAQFSNQVTAFLNVSAPRFHETDFVNDLIRIINEHKIDVLFPTCEEIFWISKNKTRILENCHVNIICDDIEKLSLLHNKYRFIQFAKSENLSTPETHILHAGERFDQMSVIKPIFSRFGANVIITDDPKKVSIADEVCEQCIIQEFIEGESVCSYGYAVDGILKFNICYQSPFRAKTFTAFQPFQSEAVNEMVRTIVEKLNFTGNISFDFIRKEDTYFVIECNPRITSGIHTLRHNRFEELFFDSVSEPVCKPAQLFFPTLASSFRLVTYEDVIWNGKDIKPFLNQIRCLMSFHSIAKKQKVSLTEAMTYDIEWNGNGIE